MRQDRVPKQRARARDPLRRGLELDARAADGSVQPTVLQPNRTRLDFRVELRAPPFPLCAPHLEDVGEIGAEEQLERDLERTEVVVVNPQAVVADSLPEKAAPEDVNRVARPRDHAVRQVIRIGQIDDQEGVVLLHGRAEQQRAPVVDQQHQVAQEPGPLVVEPFLSPRQKVSRAVEDGERVGVLQHPDLIKRPGRARQNRKVLFELDTLVHVLPASFGTKPDSARRAGRP